VRGSYTTLIRTHCSIINERQKLLHSLLLRAFTCGSHCLLIPLTLFKVDSFFYCINEIIRPVQSCLMQDHSEGVRNLCVNIYGCRDSLSDCKFDQSDKMCIKVFTRSDLHLGAEHVLEHAAHILCTLQLSARVHSREYGQCSVWLWIIYCLLMACVWP